MKECTAHARRFVPNESFVTSIQPFSTHFGVMSQSAPAWSGKQHVGQLYLTLAQFAVELAVAHWVVPGLQPKITWGVHGRNQTQEERNLNSENVQFYFSVLVKMIVTSREFHLLFRLNTKRTISVITSFNL